MFFKLISFYKSRCILWQDQQYGLYLSSLETFPAVIHGTVHLRENTWSTQWWIHYITCAALEGFWLAAGFRLLYVWFIYITVWVLSIVCKENLHPATSTYLNIFKFCERRLLISSSFKKIKYVFAIHSER